MHKQTWDDEDDERWFQKLELPARLKAELNRLADEAWERCRALQAMEEEGKREKARADAQAVHHVSGLDPKVVFVDSPLLAGNGPAITLVESAQIQRVAAKLGSVGLGDKQRKEWAVKTIEHVAARGSKRIVHRRLDWKPALAALRDAHANFVEVIDVVEDELTLAGDQPISLPALLLNGPPGCGKTFFAQHLAKFFETGFERVSMETAQTSAELVGTAAHWSNAAPGRLFNRLIDYDYANPLFLLDEIDKAGGYEAHRSDKALYALLERETAKTWSDAAFPDLVLDTSHVVWVLTSNDAREIPGPLVSRMQRFDIEPLGANEAQQLVGTLYRREVERFTEFELSPELASVHCKALSHLSPRILLRITRRLVARLARQHRTTVSHGDLEAVGALMQAGQDETGRKAAIGFMRPPNGSTRLK